MTIEEEVIEEFKKKMSEDLKNNIINVAKVAYTKFLYKTNDKDICSIEDDDIGIIFYANDNAIYKITEATNLFIELSYRKYHESLGFAVIDIFSDRVELYDGFDVVAKSIIDLSGLTPESVDDGYVFQLNTICPFQPFSTEQFKSIIGLANNLKDEEIC